MPARATPSPRNALASLRRSVLGAWLAVAYALAVLASGLAPAPLLAASPALTGALLCSGAVAPGHEVPAPADEVAHCKGCPLNPVLAGPASVQPAIDMIAAVLLAALQPGAEGLPCGMVPGLPGSRGPPVPGPRI